MPDREQDRREYIALRTRPQALNDRQELDALSRIKIDPSEHVPAVRVVGILSYCRAQKLFRRGEFSLYAQHVGELERRKPLPDVAGHTAAVLMLLGAGQNSIQRHFGS